MDKKTMAVMSSGSIALGMGHIMRTLAIADKMRKHFNVIYICKSDKEYETGIKELKRRGYPVYYEEDKVFADIILVDSYDMTEQKLSSLRKKYGKLIYIDDLHCLDYYDCDIIINKTLRAKELKYPAPPDCKILLGTEYALLRSEFQRVTLPLVNENVKNVLITMGGTDPKGTSVKVLNILKKEPFTFFVAVSGGFSDSLKEKLNHLACENENIILKRNPNMAELIAGCDLAITANGGTSQEIASLGVPSIALSIVDNQNEDLAFGERTDLFLYAGREENLTSEKLISLFYRLVNDFNLRREMSEKQKSVINRNGADLVEKEILNLGRCPNPPAFL